MKRPFAVAVTEEARGVEASGSETTADEFESGMDSKGTAVRDESRLCHSGIVDGLSHSRDLGIGDPCTVGTLTPMMDAESTRVSCALSTGDAKVRAFQAHGYFPLARISQAATKHALKQFTKWHAANHYKWVVETPDCGVYYFCSIASIKESLEKLTG